MDAFTTSDFIMYCDSDDSDLDFSGDDFDIQTRDSESDDDAVLLFWKISFEKIN